jgi:hypothetical protein
MKNSFKGKAAHFSKFSVLIRAELALRQGLYSIKNTGYHAGELEGENQPTVSRGKVDRLHVGSRRMRPRPTREYLLVSGAKNV